MAKSARATKAKIEAEANRKLRPGVYLKEGTAVTIRFTYRGKSTEERFADWPNTGDEKEDELNQTLVIMRAEAKRREVNQDIATGRFNYIMHFPNGRLAKLAAKRMGVLGFGVVAANALEDYRQFKKNSVREKTLKEMANRINNLFIPYFKLDKDIATITEREIYYFFFESVKTQHMAIKTRRNLHGTLNMIFKYAMDQNYIEKNPCAGKAAAEFKKHKRGETAPNPFEQEHIPRLLKSAYEAGKNNHEGRVLRNLVQFVLFTGLRTGELFGLTWDKVTKTEHGYMITVDMQVNTDGYTSTKTRTVRFVDLCDHAIEAIEDQRQITGDGTFTPITVEVGDTGKEAKEKQFKKMRKQFVFINPNTKQPYTGAKNFDAWKKRIYPKFQDMYLDDLGGFKEPKIPQHVILDDNPNKAIQDFLNQAQQEQRNAAMPWRTFYECRHTFASQLISGGAGLELISRLLGHANTAITAKHYAVIIEKNRKSNAPAINAALSFSIAENV